MTLPNLVLPAVGLAEQLHRIIQPGLGLGTSSAIVGEANSGDYTYAIDEQAERAIGPIVDALGKQHGLRLAYYSEDRGLVEVHADPQYVLVVDPIDGTRPSVCGLESCCVSVAMAPLDGKTTLGNVCSACLVEIKSGHMIYADNAGYLRTHAARGENDYGRSLSSKTDVSKMFWATEMCGRPTQATHAVLGDLTNASSFAGACFVFNSSSYAISRVVKGQLDAYVDFYAVLLRREGAQKWEALSRSLFQNKLFGLFPYDIAAAAFIAKQAGAFVCDGFGQSLDGLQLLDSSSKAISSAIVAGNENLGTQILRYLERGYKNADKLVLE